MSITASDLSSSLPIIDTLLSLREWLKSASQDMRSIGFVPTMGALHDGHIALLRRSLAENKISVISIFVNPAQFAPHEDLAAYPRSLSDDLELLKSISVSAPVPELDCTQPARTHHPFAVFTPSVKEMYPSGIDQDAENQRGTFVDVKGFSHQMEGTSRPTFFRGVATIITKLFNAVQPTNAYFGQKDIQQALILRRLCTDLLLSHPLPDHLHIVRTVRDPSTGLALSSRNVHLSPYTRCRIAPVLYSALQAAAEAWVSGECKVSCMRVALDVIQKVQAEIENEGDGKVIIRVDYLQINAVFDFGVVDDASQRNPLNPTPMILSGALWVDKTRLIDNIILDDLSEIISLS